MKILTGMGYTLRGTHIKMTIGVIEQTHLNTRLYRPNLLKVPSTDKYIRVTYKDRYWGENRHVINVLFWTLEDLHVDH